MKSTRRLVAAVTGAVALIGAGVLAVENGSQTPASADGSGNYVAFGDSLQVDPTNVQLAASKNPELREALKMPETPNGRCVSSDNPYPKRVGEKTGLRTENYGCAAATVEFPQAIGGDIKRQVDTALSENTLNGNTRLVTLAFGFNDWYQDPNSSRPIEDRKASAANVMSEEIKTVRQAAPNAKILMVGNPDLTDGNNNICITNAFGVATHVYYPLLSFVQDNVRAWQSEVAAQNNVEYIDMMSMINTANDNNGCAANPERLSAAYFDDAPHNLWGHLTDRGQEFYADQISSRLA